LGGLPPLGRSPNAPGEPNASGDDPDKLPPQNIRGETLIQQFARKKGKTEYEIEQIWNKTKDKAKIWQAENKSGDREMLEYAVKIFQETMDLLPDAPPPEAIAQQAAVVQAATGNVGALQGGVPGKQTEEKPGEKKAEKPAETKPPVAKPEEKKDEKSEEEKKKKAEESKTKTEAAIAQAEANLRETLGVKNAKNTLSKKDLRTLKAVGVKKADLGALNTRQITKLKRAIEKRNTAGAANMQGKEGFSFLGNAIVGIGSFAAGYAAGKALDSAFKRFFAARKTINPDFGGGVDF
jgi:hypothetical protein